MAREVACPRCGTRREWGGNPWRPFCSERCRLIDLGGWLSGDNAIPGEAADVNGKPEGTVPFSDRLSNTDKWRS